MKILVFGRLGQVGKEVGICSSEYEDTEIIYVDRKVANLENLKQCAEAIYLNIPDLIINAAAYTNVEKAEETTSFGAALRNVLDFRSEEE